MRRHLLALLLVLALPTVVSAAPLPEPPPFPPLPSPTIDCPPVDWVDGVPVPPADAPADCVYIAGGGEVDPCAPDAAGEVPLMCQSEPVEPLPGDDGFTIRSITLASGARFTPTDAALFLGSGSLRASVGCNQIAGSATLAADGSIDLLQLMMTEMYCADLNEAEQALIAVLSGGNLRLITSAEQASLESSTGRVEFAPGSGSIGSGETTNGNGWLAALLLLLPLAAAASALLLAIGSRDEERR